MLMRLIEKYLVILLKQMNASGINESDAQEIDAWLSARLGIERQIKEWP